MSGALACILVVLAAAPVSATPPVKPKPYVRPGVVLVVEGIGGLDIFPHNVTSGLKKAGLPHEVRRFAWSHGPGKFFRDLQDTHHLLRKAKELAALIRELREQDDERPIYILAHSGGAGLTLFALEELPPGTVERCVFMASAVSPTYDLRPALRTTKQGIVSFSSTHDQLILNWGTRNFGTADRYYGPSAGLRGFVVPTNLDDEGEALYGKLVQIPWRGRMLWEGNSGGHLGGGVPPFIANEVAPFLK
jgi:pimeloyl-ACP methyl ester carboxylesterase